MVVVQELEGKHDLSCLDNPFIKLPCGAVEGRKKKEDRGQVSQQRKPTPFIQTGSVSYCITKVIVYMRCLP